MWIIYFFNILLNNHKISKGQKMTGLAFPDISPIIFSIGPVAIRWYSMAYLAGILLAWYFVRRDVKKYNMDLSAQNLEDAVFYITLGIILGGRIGYMLIYGRDLLAENFFSVFQIWKGGMSFHGGIVGVIIAIYLLSKKINYKFLGLTDIVCVYVPIGIFLGRIANFINGELWGRPSDVAWAVRFPDGGYIPRHPSQLYEAGMEGLLMFIILKTLWSFEAVRGKTGITSGCFLFLYGLFRMCMEQFREPDQQIGFLFGYITMGQILSLPFLLLGAFLIIRGFKLSK